MPTHRDIAPTETDPQAPITAALMKALDENLDAVVDDDPTAPKIRRRHSVSGAAAQTQTFTGLGDYSGIAFEVFARNTQASSQNLNFQYSTDGGLSWSASTVIFSVPATTGFHIIFGSFDFTTGSLRAVGGNYSTSPPTPVQVSTTAAGASLAINAIRFQGAVANLTLTAQIKPNGGVV